MSTTFVATRLIAELPRGRVVGGADFDERRRVWNGGVDHLPAVIVRPETTREVSDTVRTARRHGLELSVRGGGHDHAGRAVRPGGLVIDLGAMRHVHISGNCASVGGGANVDDLLDAAAERGLSAALGTVGSVGVVGLTLGGGYGPLIGLAGLAIDNLLSAEVVLADGTTVVTDPRHDPDLFWALCGGGGNFGVVTSVDVQLHPVPEVTAGTIAFGWPHARSVLRGLREVHRNLNDAFDVMFGAMHTPDGLTLFTSPVWAGPQSSARKHIDRVRRLGPPAMEDVERRRLIDMARSMSDSFPPGGQAWLGSRMVAEIDDDFIDAFIASGDAMPAGCALNIHHSHGAATRVPVGAAAHAYRQPHLLVEILGMWPTGDGYAQRRWVDETERRLDAIALPGGWTNLMAPHDARARDAYGPNRTRLLAAKQRYDPDGVFTAIPLPERER